MGFGDSLSLTVTGFISEPKSIMFGGKKKKPRWKNAQTVL